MRIYIFTFFIILSISLSTFSSEDKNDILQSLDFPIPISYAWKTFNNPLYPFKIYKNSLDPSILQKEIILKEAKLKSNTEPLLYFELGNLYYSIGNYELAKNFFNNFLYITNSYTDNNEINSARGELLLHLSETTIEEECNDYLEMALYHFTRLSELEKNNSKYIENIGDCFLLLGRIDESLRLYKSIIYSDSNFIHINSKIQSAIFQKDYLNLTSQSAINSSSLTKFITEYKFPYLQSIIDNSNSETKDVFKLQQYIYILRLILFHQGIVSETGVDISSDENEIISDAERFINTMNKSSIYSRYVEYISAVIKFLKKDYDSSMSYLVKIVNNNEFLNRSIEEDLFFIYCIKKTASVKETIDRLIMINPAPYKFLCIGRIEFLNGNLDRSEMLCLQAIKLDSNYAEAYSALSVIYAFKGNYFAADEMIKKGIQLTENKKYKRKFLHSMKVNEAAIALLKNEKERSYVLLRSVLSVDDNAKGSQLYNRYFNKK